MSSSSLVSPRHTEKSAEMPPKTGKRAVDDGAPSPAPTRVQPLRGLGLTNNLESLGTAHSTPGAAPENAKEQEETDISTDSAAADNEPNAATTASAHATTASAPAINASEQATPASEQATNASEHATSASEQATNASEQATHASEQATNASEHAPSASAHATNASEQATNASAQATHASEQATNTSEHVPIAPAHAPTASEHANNASEQATHASEQAPNASEHAALASAHATPTSNPDGGFITPPRQAVNDFEVFARDLSGSTSRLSLLAASANDFCDDLRDTDLIIVPTDHGLVEHPGQPDRAVSRLVRVQSKNLDPE